MLDLYDGDTTLRLDSSSASNMFLSASQRRSAPVSPSIRHYLKNAELPRMTLASNIPQPPMLGYLSHRIKLYGIRPDQYRRLKHILRLKVDKLEHLIEEATTTINLKGQNNPI